MSKKKNEHSEGFHAGICYALLVVIDGYDQPTIGFDILKGCDTKEIRRIAKREGDASIVKLVDEFHRARRR